MRWKSVYFNFKYNLFYSNNLIFKITLPTEKRFEKLELLKKNVADNREQLSKLATLEMGKPINQTIAEVDKSIKHIDYYIQNTERFMHDEEL